MLQDIPTSSATVIHCPACGEPIGTRKVIDGQPVYVFTHKHRIIVTPVVALVKCGHLGRDGVRCEQIWRPTETFDAAR